MHIDNACNIWYNYSVEIFYITRAHPARRNFMKKKLLLTLAIVMVVALALAITVFAEEATSVHNGKVDLNATVTLDNGTVCNLFDAEGNALIWYNNGSTLESIRADDPRVIYKCTYAFGVGNSTVGSVTAYEVSDMWIQLDSSTKISKGNIVVLNLMDDDVLINNNRDIGQPVNCLKTIAWANKVLEYAFCRLDTVAVQAQAFCGCTKLKYINLEDLTELRQIGGDQPFGQSSVLFAGETLDLTGTKLCAISGNGAFNGVPLAGLKLPNTVTTLNDWNIQGTAITSFTFPTGVATIAGSQFNDCKSLKEIYINKTTTKISARAFNNTILEKVFFTGSLDELNALIANTDFTNNAPLTAVLGENNANIISYKDYLALADKTGKYVVYDYSYCEAYKDGEHTPNPEVTDCTKGVGCTECIVIIEKGYEGHEIVHTLTFPQGFDKAGVLNHKCSRDYCTVAIDLDDDGVADEQIIDKATDPIVTFKGYSVPEAASYLGINAGYFIDTALLTQYKELSGKEITIGLIMVNSADVAGVNDLIDAEGNLVSGLRGFSVKISSFNYGNLSIEIKNFQLGENQDGNYYTLSLVSAFYIKDDNEVDYIQDAIGDEADANRVTTTNGTVFDTISANRVYTAKGITPQ